MHCLMKNVNVVVEVVFGLKNFLEYLNFLAFFEENLVVMEKKKFEMKIVQKYYYHHYFPLKKLYFIEILKCKLGLKAKMGTFRPGSSVRFLASEGSGFQGRI